MVAIILNCSLLVHRNSTEGPRCPVWWFHSGYPEHEHLSFLWASRELGSWPRWWLRWKSICLQCGRPGFNPWVGKISWRRQWQPTLVFLPGKSHGRRSLVGYSPRGLRVRHDWATSLGCLQHLNSFQGRSKEKNPAQFCLCVFPSYSE